MEIPPLSWYYVLLTAGSLLLFFFLWRRECGPIRPLPPGPPAWLIVRNLFHLVKKPHESLHALSLQYGPLMTLRLGVRSLVSCHCHGVWGAYGPHWRHFRRISTVELFSPKRVDALQHLRRDQVFRTVQLFFQDKGKVVDIGLMVFYTTLNLFGNLIFGANMCDPHDPASAELKNTIWKIMKLVAMPNMADYFPFLRFLDPQGVSCAMTRHLRLLYNFSDAFIQKRLASTSQSVKPDDSEKDFPGVLLDSRSGDFTSLSGIRALVAELFAAGTETTTTLTIEWAIAEFIRNPQKLNRVRQELNEVVGCNRRLEESVVDRQPYLHAAVKETLRLHPAVPVIVPHEAESSCEIGGFTIPKHSQVVLNVWAIGRDPSVWKNPSEFMPERFLEGENSKIEYSGQNFELIPFGAGRRMCPAIPLASRTIHIVVAS
ncbi:hypothetical protein SUGI_0648990 [Cryptomeria japonica]|nr:hypothetical protein SUGI_0648990 [Cryptomeria japonica]